MELGNQVIDRAARKRRSRSSASLSLDSIPVGFVHIRRFAAPRINAVRPSRLSCFISSECRNTANSAPACEHRSAPIDIDL